MHNAGAITNSGGQGQRNAMYRPDIGENFVYGGLIMTELGHDGRQSRWEMTCCRFEEAHDPKECCVLECLADVSIAAATIWG